MTFGRWHRLQRINSLRVNRGGVAARCNISLNDLYRTDLVSESEEESMASDVDAMVSTLDERYGKNGWDMWRAAIGGWVVKIESDKSTHSKPTIGQALQWAIDHKPLPVVPRRPSLFSADGADIYKAGKRGWRVEYRGRDCCVWLDTKKLAEQWAKQEEERADKAYENWMANYGWTLGKQEGVDFRYE